MTDSTDDVHDMFFASLAQVFSRMLGELNRV